MKVRTILHILCLLATLSSACLARVEVTPFYGYQFGGDFEDAETGERYDLSSGPCAGAQLNLDLSDITQLEFYYSHQETELEAGGLFPSDTFFDLDVDYYHLGGTLLLGEDQWQPFVVGTLGATHLSPEPSSIGSLTRFSLGLGGGLRYFPTEHLGLYLAGRALFTFIDSDTRIHIESGATTAQIHTDGLAQAVLQAGLIFRF
jgi:hypothetical protein